MASLKSVEFHLLPNSPQAGTKRSSLSACCDRSISSLWLTRAILAPLVFACLLVLAGVCQAADVPSRDAVLASMKRAAMFYRNQVATHGGYVYHYSLDLKQRWGEGAATADQIWVQPPGTPTVGLAYLAAWQATNDRWYLEAATKTANALVYGQLKSGGWTNSIDFDPKNPRTAGYRNGKGKGKINSTLDDGITQSALQFLMRMDQALKFKDQGIHESAELALKSLLAAQFPNGGFPQVWTGPVEKRPIVKAAYPNYEWRTENRVKEYWTMYTLNDDLAGDVAETLLVAHEIYPDVGAFDAFKKLGDFLILAQLPQPQPAWAQQYDVQMRPIWARKFEPPAVTGRESQDAIEVLMLVYERTGDAKYLKPIPSAIDYLKKSRLPDGRMARYYELQSNKPLYMNSKYELTYDDSDVPDHYGWKVESNLDRIEKRYQSLKEKGVPSKSKSSDKPGKKQIEQVVQILTLLDDQGRWTTVQGEARLVGQPKIRPGDRFISSQVFATNITTLSHYLTSQGSK